MPMEWSKLLNNVRLGESSAPQDDDVRGFGQDYDRILYSLPFRRLLDKTQVFPMPANDHIHNRLIHSVEVASVGRQLGVRVGKKLSHVGVDLGSWTPNDLGDIVASACLMHDIGNPPFGHAGEDAIASWFRGPGRDHVTRLDDPERLDFQQFEGNAQSFRVVTRLEMYGENRGGMRLRLATLGAVAKYPQMSLYRQGNHLGRQNYVAHKKFNYFQADKMAFKQMAEGVGLTPVAEQAWVRHPLAYLVEAADDICYSILDLEDGYTLGLVSRNTICELLQTLIGPDVTNNSHSEREHIAHLRALAIGRLIKSIDAKFIELHDQLLEGTVQKSLIELIDANDAMKRIKEASFDLCYQADEVLRVELAGYEALGGLLDVLVPAALERQPNGRQKRALTLMGFKTRGEDNRELNDYERLLQVTDYLSGMTDSYALRLYRQFRGIELPTIQGRASVGRERPPQPDGIELPGVQGRDAAQNITSTST